MMIGYLHSLSSQDIPFPGGREIHDIVLNTKGQLSATVHHRRKGKVGKCKESTTLTYAPSVQVLMGDRHRRNGTSFT